MNDKDFVHVTPLPSGCCVAIGIWDEEAGGYRVQVDCYFGCQDRGCIINPPKQGTNGGCRCLKHIKPTSLRIEAARKIREAMTAVPVLGRK